jgi:hypothetical protein
MKRNSLLTDVRMPTCEILVKKQAHKVSKYNDIQIETAHVKGHADSYWYNCKLIVSISKTLHGIPDKQPVQTIKNGRSGHNAHVQEDLNAALGSLKTFAPPRSYCVASLRAEV